MKFVKGERYFSKNGKRRLEMVVLSLAHCSNRIRIAVESGHPHFYDICTDENGEEWVKARSRIFKAKDRVQRLSEMEKPEIMSFFKRPENMDWLAVQVTNFPEISANKKVEIVGGIINALANKELYFDGLTDGNGSIIDIDRDSFFSNLALAIMLEIFEYTICLRQNGYLITPEMLEEEANTLQYYDDGTIFL